MTIKNKSANGETSNKETTSERERADSEDAVLTPDKPTGEGADNKDDDELDPRERKVKHWEESPFAVGLVNVNWADDRPFCRPAESRHMPTNNNVCCSAIFCGCIGAGRVGNLAVLAQTTEEYDHIEVVDDETGERRTTRRKRPKLLWVVGPFWPVNLCITYPLIFGVSFLVGWRNIPYASAPFAIIFYILTGLLSVSLAMVACRNPGVLPRYSERPENAADWRWNDQAKTYRPPKARFDPECQAVIEGFDHT